MESPKTLEDRGYLLKKLADSIARQTENFRSMLPPTELLEHPQYRVAMQLLGYASVLYAIQLLGPRTNPEVAKQAAAIKALNLVIKNDLAKTGCSHDIFTGLCATRTLGDLAFDRLIGLFRLAGIADVNRATALLPSFIEWHKSEVEFFVVDLQNAWAAEQEAREGEFDLSPEAPRKGLPQKPRKKIGRTAATTTH